MDFWARETSCVVEPDVANDVRLSLGLKKLPSGQGGSVDPEDVLARIAKVRRAIKQGRRAEFIDVDKIMPFLKALASIKSVAITAVTNGTHLNFK